MNGPLWEQKGLLGGAGTADPVFTGAPAVAEYAALGGDGPVPWRTPAVRARRAGTGGSRGSARS